MARNESGWNDALSLDSHSTGNSLERGSRRPPMIPVPMTVQDDVNQSVWSECESPLVSRLKESRAFGERSKFSNENQENMSPNKHAISNKQGKKYPNERACDTSLNDSVLSAADLLVSLMNNKPKEMVETEPKAIGWENEPKDIPESPQFYIDTSEVHDDDSEVYGADTSEVNESEAKQYDTIDEDDTSIEQSGQDSESSTERDSSETGALNVSETAHLITEVEYSFDIKREDAKVVKSSDEDLKAEDLKTGNDEEMKNEEEAESEFKHDNKFTNNNEFKNEANNEFKNEANNEKNFKWEEWKAAELQASELQALDVEDQSPKNFKALKLEKVEEIFAQEESNFLADHMFSPSTAEIDQGYEKYVVELSQSCDELLSESAVSESVLTNTSQRSMTHTSGHTSRLSSMNVSETFAKKSLPLGALQGASPSNADYVLRSLKRTASPNISLGYQSPSIVSPSIVSNENESLNLGTPIYLKDVREDDDEREDDNVKQESNGNVKQDDNMSAINVDVHTDQENKKASHTPNASSISVKDSLQYTPRGSQLSSPTLRRLQKKWGISNAESKELKKTKANHAKDREKSSPKSSLTHLASPTANASVLHRKAMLNNFNKRSTRKQREIVSTKEINNTKQIHKTEDSTINTTSSSATTSSLTTTTSPIKPILLFRAKGHRCRVQSASTLDIFVLSESNGEMMLDIRNPEKKLAVAVWLKSSSVVFCDQSVEAHLLLLAPLQTASIMIRKSETFEKSQTASENSQTALVNIEAVFGLSLNASFKQMACDMTNALSCLDDQYSLFSAELSIHFESEKESDSENKSDVSTNGISTESSTNATENSTSSPIEMLPLSSTQENSQMNNSNNLHLGTSSKGEPLAGRFALRNTTDSSVDIVLYEMSTPMCTAASGNGGKKKTFFTLYCTQYSQCVLYLFTVYTHTHVLTLQPLTITSPLAVYISDEQILLVPLLQDDLNASSISFRDGKLVGTIPGKEMCCFAVQFFPKKKDLSNSFQCQFNCSTVGNSKKKSNRYLFTISANIEHEDEAISEMHKESNELKKSSNKRNKSKQRGLKLQKVRGFETGQGVFKLSNSAQLPIDICIPKPEPTNVFKIHRKHRNFMLYPKRFVLLPVNVLGKKNKGQTIRLHLTVNGTFADDGDCGTDDLIPLLKNTCEINENVNICNINK